jgi:hypothetical protein
MTFAFWVEFVRWDIEKAKEIVILFRIFFNFASDKFSPNMECKNGKVIKLWFLRNHQINYIVCCTTIQIKKPQSFL